MVQQYGVHILWDKTFVPSGYERCVRGAPDHVAGIRRPQCHNGTTAVAAVQPPKNSAFFPWVPIYYKIKPKS